MMDLRVVQSYDTVEGERKPSAYRLQQRVAGVWRDIPVVTEDQAASNDDRLQAIAVKAGATPAMVDKILAAGRDLGLIPG
jgi:hypothetical protein